MEMNNNIEEEQEWENIGVWMCLKGAFLLEVFPMKLLKLNLQKPWKVMAYNRQYVAYTNKMTFQSYLAYQDI